MTSVGEWLREKVGMSTKEEVEKRGEEFKGSRRDQQIEREVRKAVGTVAGPDHIEHDVYEGDLEVPTPRTARDAPSGKFTNGKNGVDAGEAGPKWKDTFK